MQPDESSPAPSPRDESVRHHYDVEHSSNEPLQPKHVGTVPAAGESSSTATITAARRTPARQRYRSALADSPTVQPTPVPQRPRYRWFVGLMLLSAGACVAFAVWNSHFRYQAYGVITGRLIEVSAAWEGVAQSFQVHKGDHVQQGDVLLTLDNLVLNQQLARVSEDLQIAQAKLQAEMSALQWQSQARQEQSKKAQAEYYERWGELLQSEAKLADLNARMARFEAANKRFNHVVSDEEIESLSFERDGLQSKVEKLTLAVEELKNRIDFSDNVQSNVQQQFEPQVARIASLTTELKRLRTRIEQGRIRAPVSGRVVNIHVLRGERAIPSKPIVEIVEDGSYEATLYLSQNCTNTLRPGDRVELWLKPNQESRSFLVTSVGEQMEVAPDSLQRRYAKDEELLPVHLTPTVDGKSQNELRLGSEVMLLN